MMAAALLKALHHGRATGVSCHAPAAQTRLLVEVTCTWVPLGIPAHGGSCLEGATGCKPWGHTDAPAQSGLEAVSGAWLRCQVAAWLRLIASVVGIALAQHAQLLPARRVVAANLVPAVQQGLRPLKSHALAHNHILTRQGLFKLPVQACPATSRQGQ